MWPRKAAGLILCVTALTVSIVWRLGFIWLQNFGEKRVVKVTFDYPLSTGKSSPKPDVLFRQARSTVNELWRLSNAQLPNRKQPSPSISLLNNLLFQATLQLTARLDLLDKLSGRRESRRQDVDALSSELRHQISRLQNPPNCSQSRFALAELRYSCGFGCSAHHMALKFSFAFATNRTLLLQQNDWKDFFLPFSNCSLKHAEGQSDIPHIENGLPGISTRYYAPAMPSQWSEKLSKPLGDPFPWYRGHLLDYILRPRDLTLRHELEMALQGMRKVSDAESYDGPIASIHIRRTDKLHSEAKFHAVEEYMFHVERFFELKEVEYGLETGSTKPPPWSRRRRVFLASDDASVFQEARSKYPRYEFIGRQRNGSVYKNRWSTAGVFAILVDLHLLVSSDFLVCTGSSNVCRLAYELLSAKSPIRGDSAFQMQSVDQMYQCVHSQRRWWRAIADFRQEAVKLGDLVSISSTRWDGFVQTARTQYITREDAVPAYLFEEIVQSI
ncbi:Alpha-(1,6)-fucosyltransferase [Sparganum proliferum]